MIHFSTFFVVQLLTRCCQFSYTSFVLDTSILLPPPSTFIQNNPTSISPFYHDLRQNVGPDSETEEIVTVTSNLSKVPCLKAAIFHTMAIKLSVEFNKNKVTHKSLLAFLNVLYHVTKIKKKKITLEQYSRLHLEGPKIAICETSSNVVFVLNSSFTSKDYYFRAALDEAMTAFNKTLQEFCYTQTLEYYDPHVHQKRNNNINPPQQHPFFH